MEVVADESDFEVNRYMQQHIESTRGDQKMKQITVRLFVRSEKETEYRNWDDLTESEKAYIGECLNREAAHAGGFIEKT